MTRAGTLGAAPEVCIPSQELPFGSTDLLREFIHLDKGWEVLEIRYTGRTGTLIVALRPVDGWWNELLCPACHGRQISFNDHGKKHSWRHLDVFSIKTIFECALPRAKCGDCRRIFQVKTDWQGRSRHFTKDFEAFALSLIRETNVKSAGRILCESDRRLWRMLFAYIEGAHAELSTVAISILHREWYKSGAAGPTPQLVRTEPPTS